MPNYGVPGTIGLSPDAPALPGEWREASGLAFACLEAAEGRPADALLAALFRHHPRMHDGRTVDAVETARIDRVLSAPGARLPQMPIVEIGEMGEPLSRSRETSAERRARIAALVPAGKVRGWVPAWKREDAATEPAVDTAANGAISGPLAAEVVEPATPMVPPPRPGVAGESHLAAPLRPGQCAATAAPGSTTRAGSRGVSGEQRLPAAAAGQTTVPPSASPAAASGAPRPRPPMPPRAKRLPSIEHIIVVAERYARVAPGSLVPEARSQGATMARQVAMWLAATLLGWDLTRLGTHFGRDRTTVRYTVRAVTERRDRDDALADALDTLVAEAKAEPRTRLRKIAP